MRTHEIAERAGVNKAMIYYWYQSKEQLLRAVLQKILFELIALSQEILARKLPAGEVLEEFYRGFFYYTARHRNFSRLTTMDLGSEGGYLRTMFESFFRPLFERGVKFIELAVERVSMRVPPSDRHAADHDGAPVLGNRLYRGHCRHWRSIRLRERLTEDRAQLLPANADNLIMNADEIRALASDLRVRERTEALCALLNINPLRDRERVAMLMQEMLDVAIEGWLSARALAH